MKDGDEIITLACRAVFYNQKQWVHSRNAILSYGVDFIGFLQ